MKNQFLIFGSAVAVADTSSGKVEEAKNIAWCGADLYETLADYKNECGVSEILFNQSQTVTCSMSHR